MEVSGRGASSESRWLERVGELAFLTYISKYVFILRVAKQVRLLASLNSR